MRLTKDQKDVFRRMGRRGGKNRAAMLTPEQRSEQAQKAVKARWAKKAAEAAEAKAAETATAKVVA